MRRVQAGCTVLLARWIPNRHLLTDLNYSGPPVPLCAVKSPPWHMNCAAEVVG